MELLELTTKTLEIFRIDDVSELPKAAIDAAIGNDDEVMQAFINTVEDLSVDWMQRIFQYYLADRGELSQDFTPESLGKLICSLTDGGNCIDLCAGSGALTIQRWTYDQQAQHTCIEKDSDAFSFLCFNIAVRNIDATVILGDAITLEYMKAYRFEHGDKFSTAEELDTIDMYAISADVGISNPPYNIKWSVPDFAPMQERFVLGVPPKQNANLAFVLTLMKMCDRCALILPNGVLTSSIKEELAIRNAMLEENLIDAVISLPEKMFESTDIPVCIVVLDKNRKTTKVEMVNACDMAEQEVREQRGQYGGASHTKRVYKKSVNVLSDDAIDKIRVYCDEKSNVDGVCRAVMRGVVDKNEGNLSPKRYVGVCDQEIRYREFSDIVDDINRCARYKSMCKLTINETLAKSIGVYEVKQLQDTSNKIIKQMNSNLSFLGIKFENEDFIRTTKNKNEFTFSNNSKEDVSNILMMLLSQWKARVHFMNTEQNIFMAELRDAMLPKLMSGEIDIPDNASVGDDDA